MKFKIQSRRGQGTVRDVGVAGVWSLVSGLICIFILLMLEITTCSDCSCFWSGAGMGTDTEEGLSRAAERREPGTGCADGCPRLSRAPALALGMGLPIRAGLFSFLISTLCIARTSQTCL